MPDYSFSLDGVDARTVGIRLQSPFEISEAEPNYTSRAIPGRNGNFAFWHGNYDNRTGYAACFLLDNNVLSAVSASSRFLMDGVGYRRLETTEDPDHYMMAVVKKSPAIAIKAGALNTFDVYFEMKPQRFLKSGEEPVEFYEAGAIFNPCGQTAHPMIVVYGSGEGALEINNTVVEIRNLVEWLCIDSDTQNAYNASGNQNNNIRAVEFPTLKSGNNTVAFSGGVEMVEITPRWWEL